jgi:hypothetical protein
MQAPLLRGLLPYVFFPTSPFYLYVTPYTHPADPKNFPLYKGPLGLPRSYQLFSALNARSVIRLLSQLHCSDRSIPPPHPPVSKLRKRAPAKARRSKANSTCSRHKTASDFAKKEAFVCHCLYSKTFLHNMLQKPIGSHLLKAWFLRKKQTSNKLSFAVSMVSTPNTAKKTRFHTWCRAQSLPLPNPSLGSRLSAVSKPRIVWPCQNPNLIRDWKYQVLCTYEIAPSSWLVSHQRTPRGFISTARTRAALSAFHSSDELHRNWWN